MRAVAIKPAMEVAERWRWRDREGQFHDPREMETRHLFHTFRMIWNNAMPLRMRVGRVRLYQFDPRFYSSRYFAEAILAIGPELFGRTDIRADWAREIDEMRRWFVAEQVALTAATKLIASKAVTS